MSTTKITLAKALKVKNRLAGRIGKLQAEISQYNSVSEGSEQVDVKSLYELLNLTVTQNVDLKVKISEANTSIQRLIFTLAEHKSRLEFLSKLNTKHGDYTPEYSYGDSNKVSYVAAIRKTDVDAETARLETLIDEIQERLDKYNHTTEVEVDSRLLQPCTTVGTVKSEPKKKPR